MYQPTLQALRNSSFYLCRESSQSTSRIILGSPEFSLDFCDGRIVSATGTSANLLIFLVPLAGLHSQNCKRLRLLSFPYPSSELFIIVVTHRQATVMSLVLELSDGAGVVSTLIDSITSRHLHDLFHQNLRPNPG